MMFKWFVIIFLSNCVALYCFFFCGVLYISLCFCSQFLGPGGAEGGEREGRSVGDADVHIDGVVISVDHFQKALDQLRSSHSDAIGAPKVSHTSQCSTVLCDYLVIRFHQ